MAKFKASESLRARIKGFEGTNPLGGYGAYIDPAGVKTEGYGDTLNTGAPTVTKEDAERRLDENLALFESQLSEAVTRDDLNQDQQDALIDQVFNVGLEGSKKIIERVNARDDQGVADALPKYNKAKDPKTGELVELPGLTDRAQWRSQVWAKALSFSAAPAIAAEDTALSLTGVQQGISDDEIASAIAPTQEQNIGGFSVADIDKAIQSTAPVDQVDYFEKVSLSQLEDARVQAEDIDKIKYQESLRLAKEYGIEVADAKALVDSPEFKTLKVMTEHKNILKNNPVLSKWASAPENYALLKDDPSLAKIEEAGGFWTDIGKIAENRIYYGGQQSAIHALIATGAVNPLDGAKTIDELNAKIKANPFTKHREKVAKLGKIGQNAGDAFGTIAEDFVKLYEAKQVSEGDVDRAFKFLVTSAKNAGMGGLELANFVYEVSTAAPSYIVLAADSFASSAVPTLAGLASSLFLSPAGGFATTYAISGANNFGIYAQEQIEKSGMTAQEFYSDPKRVKDMQIASGKYALTTGTVDAFQQLFGGKLISSALNVGAEAGKKELVKGVLKAATKEGLVQGGINAVQETGARLAAGEDAKSAVSEGVVEALVPGPGQAAADVISGGLKVFNPRQEAYKVLSKIREAAKAKAQKEAFDRVKEAQNQSPSAKTNPDQVNELVNQSLQSKDRPVSEPYAPEPTGNTAEEVVQDETEFDNREDFDREEVEIENADQEVKLRFAPSEWADYWNSQGVNPLDALKELGPEVAKAYTEAAKSDSTFEIPAAMFNQFYGDAEGLTDIAYFNDSIMNAKEAQVVIDQSDDMVNTLVSSITMGEDPPGVPDEAQGLSQEEDLGPTFETAPVEGSPVLRPIYLKSIFKSESDRRAFESIRQGVAKVLKPFEEAEGIGNEQIDAIAQLQFRHASFRSKATGIPVEQITRRLGFKAGDLPGKRAGEAELRATGDDYRMLVTLDPNKVISWAEANSGRVLLHELSHTWMDEMMMDWDRMHGMDKATMTDDQRNYLEAMDTLSELLNEENLGKLYIDSVFNRNKEADARRTRLQETFAQTAEKYFFENKILSGPLERMFSSFREWLRPVAAYLGLAYDAYRPLKISPKVKRAFEVILDASEKSEQEIYTLFPPPMFDPQILGAKAPEYIAAYKRARDEAIAELYHKSFSRSVNEREAAIDVFIDEIYKDATAEIESRQSMRILRAFRRLPSEARISHESFVEMFPENMKEKIAKGIVAGKKKAGRDIKEVMLELGYYDQETFLADLVETSRRDEMIDRRADEIIDERYPALKSDEEIHTIAEQEVSDKGRAKLALLEFELLSSPEVRGLAKAIATPAAKFNRKSKDNVDFESNNIAFGAAFHGYRPRKFRAEALYHAKQAAVYLGKGDVEEALNRKQMELIYTEAAVKGEAILKEIAKGVASLNRIMSAKEATVNKAYDIDGYKHLRQVAIAFTKFKPLPLLQNARGAGYNQQRIDDLNTKVQMINTELAGYTDIRKVSADTFIKFHNLIKELRKAAADSKVIEQQGRKEMLAKSRENFKEMIGKINPNRMPKDGFALWYSKNVQTMQSLARGMFDNDDDFVKSPLGRWMTRLEEQQAKFILDKEQDLAAMAEAARAMLKARPGLFNQDTLKGQINAKIGTPVFSPKEVIFSPELGRDFTLDEVQAIILNMMSESNLSYLVEGHGWGTYDFVNQRIDDTKVQDFINRLIREKILTKENFDFAQATVDIFKRHYPGVRSSYRTVYGGDMGKIEGRRITNELGTWEGGYYPIIVDEAYRDLTQPDDAFSTAMAPRQFNSLFPSTNIGMTKTRNQNPKPLRLSMSGFPRALHSVLQLKHLSPDLHTFGQLMQDPELIKEMDGQLPGFRKDFIRPFYQRVLGQQYARSRDPNDNIGKTLDRAASVARRNSRVLWFTANIKSALTQYLGLLPALTRVSTKGLYQGFVKAAKDKEAVENFIASKSIRMQSRFKNHQELVLRSYSELETNFMAGSKVQSIAEKAVFFLINATQTHVDRAVWITAYREALGRGNSDSDAVTVADTAVEATQGANTPSSKASIQFTSEAAKLLTDFLNESVRVLGLNLEAYRRSMSKEGYKRYEFQAKTALLSYIIPSAILGSFSVSTLMSSPSGDGEDEFLDNVATRIGADGLELFFPIVGRFFGSLIKGMDAGDAALSLVPAISTAAKTTARAGRAIRDSLTGVDSRREDAYAILDAATLFTGIPFSIAGRVGKFVDMRTEEEIKISKKIRRKQQNIRSKRSKE